MPRLLSFLLPEKTGPGPRPFHDWRERSSISLSYYLPPTTTTTTTYYSLYIQVDRAVKVADRCDEQQRLTALPNTAGKNHSFRDWVLTSSWPYSAVFSIFTQLCDTNTTPAYANIWLHALAIFGLLVWPADSREIDRDVSRGCPRSMHGLAVEAGKDKNAQTACALP